jgi:hypothetical protein
MRLGMIADAARQSFIEHLRNTRQIKPSDPWNAALQKIKGQLGYDGLERISTDAVFEQLDLPRLKRTPEAAKRLRGLMLELGWTPVRARSVTSRGRAARVRGYARMRVPVEPNTIEP